MIETLQDLRNPEPVQQIHYVTYVFDPRKMLLWPSNKKFPVFALDPIRPYEKKRPRKNINDASSTSIKQNSSSTRLCYHYREPYNKKHEFQCRTKNVKCEECGMTYHFKRYCKKLGNFPKDSSNKQNQSSSTGSGRMNVAAAASQLDADFFDEKGLSKVY